MSLAPPPLAQFIRAIETLTGSGLNEIDVLRGGRRLLAELVSRDDWLPDAFSKPAVERYRQYLLFRDPRARFSLVSFVWGPGQSTPIHDHTVWGLVGVLRGAEASQRYRISPSGAPVEHGPPDRLERGAVEAVSPTVGDIHRVSNALADRASISIHLYGADIGAVRRWVYSPSGDRKPFTSGYDNSDANPPFVLDGVEQAA